jgi:hypothetical protein
MIDMGKHRKIGESTTKQIHIESNCPVNFGYKIEVTEHHPDIVINPQQGDIWGLESTYIDVTYTPQSYNVLSAEIRLKTTEFDSEYRYCRIIGNSMPAPRNAGLDQD